MTLNERLRQAWGHPRTQQARAEFKAYRQDIVGSLNRGLFEATPDFWRYHICGVLALITLDLVLTSIFRPAYLWDFKTIAMVVWGSGFFVSGLALRSHYKRADWDSQSQTAVLFKSIASAIFFSFFIVSATSLVAMTLSFEDLYRFHQSVSPEASRIGVAVEFFFSNWFGTTFYLLCWIVLYIGITSRRASKQMELDNLRLQNSLKEAELSSLSNQLNPHFLFNAINNIRFMIHEDGATAENMLMSLSTVLRYSLDSSKKMRVALADELEISQRYIDLIQVQFEERLRFNATIPDHLLQRELPPMVLQMLLENAVKHGIENIRDGGAIDVKVSEQGKNLIVEVMNDLPSETQKSKPRGRGDSDSGIGLINIGQRLDLLYGNEAAVDIKTRDNRFCVTLTIPQS